MALDLATAMRPTAWKQVVGQDTAVKLLRRMVEEGAVPHAILFQGESGCGKTTLAKVLRLKMGVADIDWTEMNSADFRGIDMVREVRRQMHYGALQGKYRCWLLDECHKLSNDAQNALLKMLEIEEEQKEHCHFFLATTEPAKLIKPIRSRCLSIKVELVKAAQLKAMLASVLERLDQKLSPKVIDAIVDACEGRPRNALKLVQQSLKLETDEERINAIMSEDVERSAADIAKVLLRVPPASWKQVADVLKAVDEDAESIRRRVLAYVAPIILNGGKIGQRAALISTHFEDYMEHGGLAMLYSRCFDLMHASK